MNSKVLKPIKNNSLLKNVQRQITKLAINKKNRKIIKKFSYIKEYDVLSFEAFRSAVMQKISKNSNGTIIMSDINDLYQANKNRGKKQVNSMIKRMINAMKYDVKSYKIDNYLLGKMGDELYLYVSDKSKDSCHNLIEDLKKISVHELSLSVGASDNLKDGIDSALIQSEQEMSEYKKKFKTEKVKRVYGKNIDNIIDCVVSTQLEKMRINLKKLNGNDISNLRQTFDKAMSEIDMGKIIEDTLKEEQMIKEYGQQKIKGITQKQEERYRKEAYYIYGSKVSGSQIEKYVLSQIISRHRVNGAQNFTYFEGEGYKDTEKQIMKDRKSDSFDMLIANISGLKKINDTYGHDAGDLAINDSIKYIQQVLKDQNVSAYSDIVVRGGDMFFVLIPDLSFSQKSALSKDLLKYEQKSQDGKKISIISSFQRIDKKKIKNNFIDVINSNIDKSEVMLEQKGFSKKINNVEDMKFGIEKMYQRLIEFDDIQILCNADSNIKNFVLDKINDGFSRVLESEKQKSQIKIYEHKSKENIVRDLSKKENINSNDKLKNTEINQKER